MAGEAATITLGRDCSVTVDDSALDGVRSVDVSIKRKEVTFDDFDGYEHCLPGYLSSTVTIETISGEDAAVFATLIGSAAVVSVAGTNASGTFIVTEVTASEPLDDVVSYSVTLRSSKAGYALE